jgi:hypothetical protein
MDFIHDVINQGNIFAVLSVMTDNLNYGLLRNRLYVAVIPHNLIIYLIDLSVFFAPTNNKVCKIMCFQSLSWSCEQEHKVFILV